MTESMAFKVSVVLALLMMYGVCFATVEEDTLAELVVLNNTMSAVQQYLTSTLSVLGGTYDASLAQLVQGGLFAGTTPNVPFLQLIYERMNGWDQNEIPQILAAIYGVDAELGLVNESLDVISFDVAAIDDTVFNIYQQQLAYLPELLTIRQYLNQIDAAIDQQYPALSGIWQGMDLANTRLTTLRDTLLLMEDDLDAIAQDLKWVVGDDPFFGDPDSWQIDGQHDSLREYLDHQIDAMERIDSRLVWTDPDTEQEWTVAELLARIADLGPEDEMPDVSPAGSSQIELAQIDESVPDDWQDTYQEESEVSDDWWGLTGSPPTSDVYETVGDGVNASGFDTDSEGGFINPFNDWSAEASPDVFELNIPAVGMFPGWSFDVDLGKLEESGVRSLLLLASTVCMVFWGFVKIFNEATAEWV